MRLQHLLGSDVDGHPQKLLEFFLRPGEIEEGAARLQAHEEIEIAVGPVFTPCDAAEDPHPVQPMPRRGPLDFRALGEQTAPDGATAQSPALDGGDELVAAGGKKAVPRCRAGADPS